jgi:hypothetical protein
MKILFRYLTIKVSIQRNFIILYIAYKSLQLLDKEDEEDVVDDNFARF